MTTANRVLPLGIALSLLVAAPIALAQTAPDQSGGGGEHHRGGGARGFAAMDANHDGVVTLEEWKAAGRREEMFNRIDVNHTGKITQPDLQAFREKMRAEHPNWGNGGGAGGGEHSPN